MKLGTKTTTGIGAIIGLMGATGLAITTGGNGSVFSTVTGGGAPADGQFCMLSDAPFFKDLETGCHPRSMIDELYDRDIVNQRGSAVIVTMTSPPEAVEASDDCRTCRDYTRMQQLGWFALSNRDQRREEFFRRACGLLGYLKVSTDPEVTYFEDGDLSAEDIAAIPTDTLLQLGGWPTNPDAGGGARQAGLDREDSPAKRAESREESRAELIDGKDGKGWAIDLVDQTLLVQPLTHADFNGDGLGDILVYIRASAQGGTAFDGVVGYLVKPSSDADISLSIEQ